MAMEGIERFGSFHSDDIVATKLDDVIVCLVQVWQLTSLPPQSFAERIIQAAHHLKDAAHVSSLIRFFKPLVQSLHAWPSADLLIAILRPSSKSQPLQLQKKLRFGLLIVVLYSSFI